MAPGSWFEWREAPPAEFAVIGDPIGHSRSPEMHHAAYRALGLAYTYVRVRVPPHEVPAALDALADLGYHGVNVTVPLKEAVIPWLECVDPFASRVRAVNTIRFSDRSGTNTDGPGLVDSLGEAGASPCPALLLGAGGSARAVGHAMAEAGYALRIWNRTFAKAEALAEELGAQALSSPDPQGVQVIVNATSASLQGESVPIVWERAEPDALAYDLMDGPQGTPFLSQASEAGLRTLGGRALLVAQGALSFRYWLDVEPPREAMREALA